MKVKRFTIVVLVLFVLSLSGLLIYNHVWALGDIECIAQSNECIEQMESGCWFIGGDHVGWYLVYGICYGHCCQSLYTVYCETGVGSIVKYPLICEDDSSLCDL